MLKDNIKESKFKGDGVIWTVFLFLCLISIIEVFSASSNLSFKTGNYLGPVLKHCALLAVGVVVMICTMNIKCRYFKLVTPFALFISFILLIVVFFVGESTNGSQRWIEFLGIQFQPSELAKGAVILATAQIISAMQTPTGADKRTIKYVLLVTLPIAALIMRENLSTAVLLVVVVFLMMFIGKVPGQQLGKLLGAMGVVVVGAACTDPAQEAFLLKNKDGAPEAVVAAVPYLREADIRTSIEHETDEEKDHQVIEGTRSHYEAVVTAADALRKEALAPDIPLIAAGHLFAASCSCGTEERSLYIGSLGQIPAEVFPETIDYLALGHLHRAQCVAGNESRRYAGSPLALDFGESKNKSVVIVDIEKAGQRPHIELLEVPCFDRLEQVCGTADEILARLSGLAAENVPMFCEVVHDQGDCRDALGSSPVVLVRVMSRAAAQNRISAADKISDVHTITPKAMFSLRLERSAGDLSEEDRSSLIAAHDEVLFELENEAGTQDAKPASFQSAQAKV